MLHCWQPPAVADEDDVDVIELVEMHSLMRSVLMSEKSDVDQRGIDGPPVLAEHDEEDDDEAGIADDDDDDDEPEPEPEPEPAAPSSVMSVRAEVGSSSMAAGGEACEGLGGWVGHVEVEMRKAVERQAQKANRSAWDPIISGSHSVVESAAAGTNTALRGME